MLKYIIYLLSRYVIWKFKFVIDLLYKYWRNYTEQIICLIFVQYDKCSRIGLQRHAINGHMKWICIKCAYSNLPFEYKYLSGLREGQFLKTGYSTLIAIGMWGSFFPLFPVEKKICNPETIINKNCLHSLRKGEITNSLKKFNFEGIPDQNDL